MHDPAIQISQAETTDLAANMIGRSNARRAARRVFGVLQDKRLNQHLVLQIMDEFVGALLPKISATKAA
jgi:sorting nexin-25